MQSFGHLFEEFGNPFRVGINVVGDVMVQGTDLLGEGVNTAARLEQMVKPDLSSPDRSGGTLKGFLSLADRSNCDCLFPGSRASRYAGG